MEILHPKTLIGEQEIVLLISGVAIDELSLMSQK